EEPRASRYGSRCSPSSHETVALLPLPLRSPRMGVDRYPWRGDPVWQRLVETRAETGSDRVFAYQSSHDPWLTSSYYIDTERDVVLFDTQLFLASAEELWTDICRNTSGELFCIIVTHAHPDHFYGNTFFRRVTPQTPIITSVAVDEDIRQTAHGRFALVQREWPSDIPASVD